MRKKQILRITIVGIVAAMAIVLEKFSFPKGNAYLKFTLYGFPIMLVGVLMGKRIGFLVGLIVGVVSQLTSEWGIGITSPLWGLAPIAWGLVSSLCYSMFKDKDKLLTIFLVVLITSLSATILNTVAMIIDGIIYGTALTDVLIKLPARLISMIILVIPYTFLLKAIKNRLLIFLNEENVN